MSNYENENVRRQDRLLDEQESMQIIQNGEFGILSMVENRENDWGAYGIPINYVWDKNNCIYFHCAPAGHKLECTDIHPMVSLCIVGRTHVISSKFTTAYESVIIRGKLTRGLSLEERMSALTLLLEKYSADDKEIGMKYAEKSFHRTEVLRLEIENITGKAKKIKP